MQLLYAKLGAGFTGSGLLWKDIVASESVRLALQVLVCVSLLVGSYRGVCNLSITPAKWGNVLSPVW